MEGKRKPSAYPILKNAPITEAVLDLRVQLPKESDLEVLRGFESRVKDRFPIRKERFFMHSQIRLVKSESKEAVETKSGTDGFLFESKEERMVVQARLDGYTFNKLKPYKDWKSFRSLAHELWEGYVAICKPVKVVRIALRYINRFEVPLPLGDFREYILTSPEVASGLPQGLSAFFMRIELHNEDIPAAAIITETMENVSESRKLPLILDIDVIKKNDYLPTDKSIWSDFDKIRDFKNKIFFESITDKARGLFK